MKTIILTIFVCAASVFSVNAQSQFLDKGVIEYEVKANIKKTMGNGSWEEMMKENLPTFKTGYYTLTFADDKSVYKFDHWDPQMKVPEWMRKDDEANNWYMDINANKLITQKIVSGSAFNISDSLPKMQWRITNENRMIAGFNCRKAVSVIFDSVYVFAFYTDEILLSGGPCSFHGLPGTILGVTIPRLFTSWIATKVSVNAVPVESIKPVASKKYITSAGLKKFIDDRTKDWGDGDDNEENKQQKARFIWGVMM